MCVTLFSPSRYLTRFICLEKTSQLLTNDIAFQTKQVLWTLMGDYHMIIILVKKMILHIIIDT